MNSFYHLFGRKRYISKDVSPKLISPSKICTYYSSAGLTRIPAQSKLFVFMEHTNNFKQARYVETSGFPLHCWSF